jgi:tRNA A37 N6-isopentenylltransferase MiaA
MDGDDASAVESIDDASDAGASGNCVPTLERGNEGKGQVGNLSHSRQIGNLSHLSKTAAQGVGYREVIEFLEGRHSLEETVELVKTHTRQLAKRQSTWFRSLSECRFVPMSGEVDSREIAEIIAR